MATLWSPDTLTLGIVPQMRRRPWPMTCEASSALTQPQPGRGKMTAAKNAAELDHQEATSCMWSQDTWGPVLVWSLVPRLIVASAVATNFYWSWQPEPVSHPSLSFPVYRCTPGVQMVPPGTRHQHCTSSCIFGNIHVFWNVLLSKQPSWLVMTLNSAIMQFRKVSVFYNSYFITIVMS